MRTMDKEVVFLLIITRLCSINAQMVNTPMVKLEALTPRGLRVTMKDDGFSSFTFTGFLDRGTATKQWYTSVPKAKKGVWTFVDRNDKLSIGEKIKYTIYFNKNNSNYRLDGDWIVQEFIIDSDGITCNISETNTMCSKLFCRGTLIFTEDFDDPARFDQWQKENMFPQGPDYPFNAYSSSNVKIKSGTLVITPSYIFPGYSRTWDMGQACTGEPSTNECIQNSMGPQILPPVVSGKVSTRKLFSFKYGRIDVRAKLPKGDWLIPEINLEPLYNEYGRQHYNSGLMRIAYVRGNQEYERELYGGPMACDKEPCRSWFLKKCPKTSLTWNSDFHEYSLIWKPDGLELLVDNEPYGEVKPDDDADSSENDLNIADLPTKEVLQRGNSFAPFDQLFYISFGVRVGGINDFTDTPGKPWKNSNPKAMMKFWKNSDVWMKTWTLPELIVDYVRVYSL